MTENEYDSIKNQIQLQVLSKLDFAFDTDDHRVYELIEDEIMILSKNMYIPLTKKKRILMDVFNSVRKYDVLQELIEDEEVTEIMVNGKDHIFVEKKGSLFQSEYTFESNEKLQDVISKIVSYSNRIVNETNPVVDARLEDGSRVNVVLAPVALNGPILTIRRFPKDPITIQDLISFNSVSQEAAEFLKTLVIAGYNIFISGGTGSGKTTFLNALSGFIPSTERVITIEDSAELQLQNIENLVRMETRNANIEGCQPITIRDLIKASLRMRPDRLIVGEVRGGEAADMIQILNTGHDGSLSTGHANSAKDMIQRLEMMILMGMDIPISAIRRQIASGLDIIVHLGRLRDKSRRVLSIVEVTGYENDEVKVCTLYEFKETGEKNGQIEGTLVRENELKNTQKLWSAGIMKQQTLRKDRKMQRYELSKNKVYKDAN